MGAALILLLALVCPLRASAQTEETPDEPPVVVEPSPAEAESPTGVESIAVTGERLDATNVQDEAQAITAFSAEDLDRANITNVESLAFNVPGLHVGQAGQAAIITLRGIGTENASLTGEPGVAFHVDGVNFGRPSAARVAFFDLESLDVKRGPQGLLGGKNSTSGSINVITNKPHDEYEVTGDVLFGNYDRVRARGAVNIPLGEQIATRFAFFHEDRDGYLDNKLLSDSRDPFDADDFGLRTHLRLKPTDSLDVLLSYDYFKQTGNGPQADVVPILIENPGCSGLASGVRNTVLPILGACLTNREVDPGGPRIDPTTGLVQRDPITGRPIIDPPVIRDFLDPGTEDPDPRSIFVDFPSAQDNRYWGWSATIDWDTPTLPLLGETRLKLLGGFRKTINLFKQDFDALDVAILQFDLDDSSDQYSSELQWSGMIAERLEWQSSLFYSHEKARRTVFSFSGDGGGGITGGGGVNAQAETGLFSDQTTNNKSYGAALHGTFHWTDDVRFSLGGRWIKDRKQTWLLREALGGVVADQKFRGCTGNLGTKFVRIDGRSTEVPLRDNEECDLTERHTMWGAGLDWRPQFGPFEGNHLFYAKIDRGAKSGGFRAGTVGDYAPEKIWAYALGSKSEFFDGRLRLNLEGFFYAYEDLQLVFINGLALRTENTDARMHGFDLEALASPIPGLTLSAIVSFLKTESLDYFSIDPSCSTESTQRGVEACRARSTVRQNLEALQTEGRADTTFAEAGGCLDPATGLGVTCGVLGDQAGLDNFSGNDLSRSPEWKVTLSAEYEIPLGSSYGTLTPRVQYTWQDDTYFRVFNQSFDLQEDFHQTDLKLIWTSPEDTWEVEAFIQNVEDEAQKSNILIGPTQFGSPALAWYAPPRFYGIRVGFRY
jgi:iron complex outermembrane receptor protein